MVNAVYKNTDRSDFDIDLMIVDRECGALDFAEENKIKCMIANGVDRDSISSDIYKILNENSIDYVYLFYTRLLRGKLIDSYSGRMINFHPSLLPACPGLHGFEDSLRSGALLIGSTVHFVDAGIDTGAQIQQTFTPVNGNDIIRLRHIIFAQQCASLYFVHRKLVNSEAIIADTSEFSLSQGFIPNIDDEALRLYKKLLG